MRDPGPFSRAVVDDICAHALEAYPRESCGLVVDGRYRPCRNVAEGDGEFRIDGREQLAARRQGTIQAVVHSHRADQGASPSKADMAAQMAGAVPWGIVVCDGQGCPELFWWGDQLPVPPLLERPFRHGVTDCWSLIRDWYRLEREILLPDFPRQDGWWNEAKGSDGNPDYYATRFAEAGFRQYASWRAGAALAQPGDVITFRIDPKIKVAHHAAVYLGQGLMLHHYADSRQPRRLSARDSVARWLDLSVAWLRRV